MLKKEEEYYLNLYRLIKRALVTPVESPYTKISASHRLILDSRIYFVFVLASGVVPLNC